MTDEVLNARLDGWQVQTASVADAVMEAAREPSADTGLLAELLGEVRALRQEMRGLQVEVAELRDAVQRAEGRPAPRATIKGYPLLPFAPSHEETAFLQ